MNTMIWKDLKLPRGDLRTEHKKYDNVASDGSLNHIYGHKMCAISYERSHLSFESLGDVDFGRVSYSIKHEGIYMFGGLFGKTAGE